MKKAAGIVGIILSVVFLVMGFISNAPDKYIKSYGDNKMYEYVGGDAYNYIIEAALRGGEISSAKTSRAIYFGAAGILLVISLSFLTTDEDKERISNQLSNIRDEVKDIQKAVHQDRESSVSQQQEQTEPLKSSTEQNEPSDSSN